MDVEHKKNEMKNGSKRTWREVVFWRNLMLYFLIFSYVGHFIEMGWVWVAHWVFGFELKMNILAHPLEPYPIYGTGVVLVILVVRPLVKRINHHILITYGIATLACAVLEYISSRMLVWQYGHNPYWWYADRPFNLGGHICLENSLLFGLLATVFLRVVFPWMEKLFRRVNQAVINGLLVMLLMMFGIYQLL